MNTHSISFLCLVVLGLAIPFSIAGCGGGNDAPPKANINSPTTSDEQSSNELGLDGPVSLRPDQFSDPSPAQPKINLYPEVVIKTNHGEITVQLDAKKAPRTVENFLQNYVEIQYYDGTVFHYVDEGMIIGGGYTPELDEKEARGEVLNEANNGLKNLRGTIAMARHPDARNSATCQFFFNLQDNASLDHQDLGEEAFDEGGDAKFGYCVFGKITDGLDVIDRIGKVDVHDVEKTIQPSGEPDTGTETPKKPVVIQLIRTPVEPVVIQSIRQIK